MADIDYDELINDAEKENYYDQDIPDDISDITLPTFSTVIDTVKSEFNEINHKKRVLDEKEDSNTTNKYACLQDYFVDDCNDRSINRIITNTNNNSNINIDTNVCFKCKCRGHWARDCPSNNNIVSNTTTTTNNRNNNNNNNNNNINSNNNTSKVFSNTVSSANTPNCNCGLEAVMKTTMKEGPNKDRQFYSCNTRSCNFFEWVNVVHTSSSSSSTTTTSNYNNMNNNNNKKNNNNNNNNGNITSTNTNTNTNTNNINEKKVFVCYKCNQEGHFANKCPNPKVTSFSSTSSSKSFQCFKCNQPGHYSNYCPNK